MSVSFIGLTAYSGIIKEKAALAETMQLVVSIFISYILVVVECFLNLLRRVRHHPKRAI
jgi:hypothetical protein